MKMYIHLFLISLIHISHTVLPAAAASATTPRSSSLSNMQYTPYTHRPVSEEGAFQNNGNFVRGFKPTTPPNITLAHARAKHATVNVEQKSIQIAANLARATQAPLASTLEEEQYDLPQEHTITWDAIIHACRQNEQRIAEAAAAHASTPEYQQQEDELPYVQQSPCRNRFDDEPLEITMQLPAILRHPASQATALHLQQAGVYRTNAAFVAWQQQ